jgi:hypothetical protein
VPGSLASVHRKNKALATSFVIRFQIDVISLRRWTPWNFPPKYSARQGDGFACAIQWLGAFQQTGDAAAACHLCSEHLSDLEATSPVIMFLRIPLNVFERRNYPIEIEELELYHPDW